jgi:hypothetical protein
MENNEEKNVQGCKTCGGVYNPPKIDNIDDIEDIAINDINKERMIYDIFTKSFKPYGEYMEEYKQKMFGQRGVIIIENYNNIDGISFKE